ncbi:MAG: glycosyltransferase family 2 protein [Planctomycetes bacterium]|nr:glycosyltransferase family 2 protein [Planctomycetota bacterium]
MNDTGAVVIGRNEGERLRRCLSTVLRWSLPVVYVDSGSTDGSPELARSMGCDVLELDPTLPFSAARARNEGFQKLTESRPNVSFIHFVDGDTEIEEAWLAYAKGVLRTHATCGAVFGVLREREPERSIYNAISELEWRMPFGEVHCFGGNVLMRAGAFGEVGGFDLSLPAGEEPELSQRLRRAGWTILSVDHPMGVHDANMTRLCQWWMRSRRSGHAYAQVCWLGSGLRDRFGLRQSLRTWFWMFGLPLVVLGVTWGLHPYFGLALPGIYLVQFLRVAVGRWRMGTTFGRAIRYCLLWFPAQFAQLLGQARFLSGLLFRRKPQLMEHKRPTAERSA